ncbi:hypothetical protein Tco_1122665 [Tanacetum coccineum]|uniref:Uncharacterized protein n=1 Tax=Tanacetum coccineum TaxID=301880 RepID=A0ABQ5J2J1_9ASTR
MSWDVGVSKNVVLQERLANRSGCAVLKLLFVIGCDGWGVYVSEVGLGWLSAPNSKPGYLNGRLIPFHRWQMDPFKILFLGIFNYLYFKSFKVPKGLLEDYGIISVVSSSTVLDSSDRKISGCGASFLAMALYGVKFPRLWLRLDKENCGGTNQNGRFFGLQLLFGGRACGPVRQLGDWTFFILTRFVSSLPKIAVEVFSWIPICDPLCMLPIAEDVSMFSFDVHVARVVLRKHFSCLVGFGLARRFVSFRIGKLWSYPLRISFRLHVYF